MSRNIVLSSLLLMGLAATMQAQVIERPQPKFWFGVSAAGNINVYTGTTQTLNSSLKAPAAFHDGMGLGPYGSFLMEYRPDPVWGVMLNLGYDNRGGVFDRVKSPCNCPEDLKTSLSYLTIEPSLRIAPFSNGFYLFLGGAYSYNINKSFTYTFERDPNNPLNTAQGDFSDIYKNVFSAQVGAGYDIPLASRTSRTQISLSPFVSYHPYFGQEPRSVESWSVSTIRVGIALKFGRAAAKPYIAVIPEKEPDMIPLVVEREIQFSVVAPLTVPVKREIKETFPLRDYVFFDEGSTEIPNRYVKLNKNQARSFREGQFQEPAPKDSTGRSQRQLSVYYNVLNILGKRMNEHPDSRIALIGSSAGKGIKPGLESAESVKSYLVTIYGINPSRISTEGRNQPIIASEQPGGKTDLVLLRDGDRRVDMVSTTRDLLEPVQISAVLVDPLESRIVFKTSSGSKESLASWSLTLKDEAGTMQYFGPYTRSQESISGNVLLGNRANGTYEVVMLGQTKDGTMIKRQSTLYLAHNAAPKEAGLRFSILFDFDQSKSAATYEKFLTETVAPLVPDHGTVIIHGHTDIIGDEAYNMKLSGRRANDARSILEPALLKAGKKGVKFNVYGFGADVNNAPFGNKFPEERFYNRTVIIDIVPSV
ncbi:MAG: OmpA family protein [Bacteroidales bacterium]|nr:OmpA family protein [Bacteroidales bacterium]